MAPAKNPTNFSGGSIKETVLHYVILAIKLFIEEKEF